MNTISDAKIFTRCSGAILIACAFMGSQAFAAYPRDVTVSETVKYDDLNLNAPAGIAALYKRIRQAAQRVCSSDADNGDVAALLAQTKCKSTAVDKAISDIHSGALSAYHQMKLGHSQTMLSLNHAQ